jgi:general secretion pathway protein K
MRKGHTHDRGAALVTVLLAVTLLTILVIEFAYSTQVDSSLAHNSLKVMQASYLARSGVNLAMLVLKNDAQEGSGVDALRDDWAHPLPPLPAGQGVVTVQVADEQGKVNLNALRNANGSINGAWREVCERLFQLRGVDLGLLDPLLDWLDADDFPEPRGAEKTQYLARTPPLTIRNDFFLTLGELGHVEGWTPALRARLDEVVTMLPLNNTKINVNTAPVEVLAALFPMIDQGTLERFLTTRMDLPVHGTNELRERLGLTPLTPIDGLRLTTVRSDFFSARAIATVEPVNQILTVLLQRRASTVIPIAWHPTFPLVMWETGT